AFFNLRGNDILNMGGGDDIIFAGDGNDFVDGGAGADIMQGGAGNDTYVVDNVNDVVDESVPGSGGIDSVRSDLTVNLSDAIHFKGAIENATLTGTANVNAIGNALANVLTGNAGNNLLNGMA